MSERREHNSSPLLKAARLWEKTSANGRKYLVGRLGGVRVLVLENRDRGTEGEPDWHLVFTDGSPPQTGGAP